jgi:hypothetical protein
MEAAFGHDFGRVRVHADQPAGAAAREVHAKAYTVGEHVVFGWGRYAPQTTDGTRLLAHELTHVLQQRHGAAVTQADGAASEDDLAEREARALADRVATGTPLPVPGVRMAPRSLQRLSIEECTPEDSPADMGKVHGDVLLALGGVDSTISQISARPLTPLTSGALMSYFKASGPEETAAIASSLRLIATGLPGARIACAYPGSPLHDLNCAPESDNPHVAVAEPTRPFGQGRILLCQPVYGAPGPAQRAQTIVHEGAHRYLGADDRGYFGFRCGPSSETDPLEYEDLRANADSYGCLVEKVGLGDIPYTGSLPEP